MNEWREIKTNSKRKTKHSTTTKMPASRAISVWMVTNISISVTILSKKKQHEEIEFKIKNHWHKRCDWRTLRSYWSLFGSFRQLVFRSLTFWIAIRHAKTWTRIKHSYSTEVTDRMFVYRYKLGFGAAHPYNVHMASYPYRKSCY